jgi:hypothetical protein
MNNFTNINNNLFSKNTYKRLSAIQNIHIDNDKYMENIVSILNYLKTLPICKHPDNKYSVLNINSPPLNALRESRFARFMSIVDAVKLLKKEYKIYLPPHEITIYGNNVSQRYINHVGNIIRWWAQIKPQKYIVTLYLTDLKKKLPPSNQPKVITEEYANSGFTFVAQQCEIHIFRK